MLASHKFHNYKLAQNSELFTLPTFFLIQSTLLNRGSKTKPDCLPFDDEQPRDVFLSIADLGLVSLQTMK